MSRRFRDSAVGVITIASFAVVSFAVNYSAGQAPSRSLRAVAAKTNLSGIWQAFSTANWDIQDHSPQLGPPQFGALLTTPPGQGIVEGNEIPYQPWAAKQKQHNFENRFTADPEVKCFLPGVPRATYMPEPFEIVQTPQAILIAYQYAGAVRTIHMGEAPSNPADSEIESWMGFSRGRWEGETLVVDASIFNDKTWFDRAGNFHSDALKVTERYIPVDADHLTYEATIDDPKVFTRSWKISLSLYRRKEKNVQLLEFKCVDSAEELIYGHLRKQPGK